MEEFVLEVWNALRFCPGFTVLLLVIMTAIYATGIWFYFYYKRMIIKVHGDTYGQKTFLQDTNMDNTIYLTMYHFHSSVLLYVVSFFSGIKSYFMHFVNSICLIICILQIHEYKDLRSVPALIAFAVTHALLTVWEQHSKFHIQQEINNQLVWKCLDNIKNKNKDNLQQVKQQTLRIGDRIPLSLQSNFLIPADVEIVQGQIFVNEKELTGEDLAIPKIAAASVSYRGTRVIKGRAIGKVIAVGNQCQMYQKSHEIHKPATAVQERITLVCIINFYLLLVISTVTSIVLYHQEIPSIPVSSSLFMKQITIFWRHFKKMLLLLNTVIPLGLQLSFSVASRILSYQISSKCQVEIRTQGIYAFQNTTSHICSDKTGTITLNRLVVAHVYPAENIKQIVANVLAVTDVTLNEEKELVRSDDMEHCLLSHYLPLVPCVFQENVPVKGGYLKYNDIKFERLLHVPFDHKLEVKYSLLREVSESSKLSPPMMLHVQGTPEAIIGFAKDKQKSQVLWQKFINECPKDDNSYKRIIAYGRKRIQQDHADHEFHDKQELVPASISLDGLEDLAFYCFHDQLVPNVSNVIQEAKKKIGGNFSILTGDKLETCIEIAHQLKIVSDDMNMFLILNHPRDIESFHESHQQENFESSSCVFINGRNFETLLSGKSTTTKIIHLLKNPRINKVVFRCSPYMKQLYIRTLQEHGECVMMIGDGINDISSCLEAQTSVSVSNGSNQLIQVTDIKIQDWTCIPTLLDHCKIQEGRIQNITGWILMKHFMTAGHLLSMLCLSNLKLLKDPSNPLIMNLFNTSIFFLMCIHLSSNSPTTTTTSSKSKSNFFQLMFKGITVGILSATSAFEFFELRRSNDVIYILLSFQVTQLVCQLLKFEKKRHWMNVLVYALICLCWIASTIYMYSSLKFYLFFLQMMILNFLVYM